jgi:hypothetical protein
VTYDPKNYEFGDDYHMCKQCGALVGNMRLHDQFHGTLDATLAVFRLGLQSARARKMMASGEWGRRSVTAGD